MRINVAKNGNYNWFWPIQQGITLTISSHGAYINICLLSLVVVITRSHTRKAKEQLNNTEDRLSSFFYSLPRYGRSQKLRNSRPSHSNDEKKLDTNMFESYLEWVSLVWTSYDDVALWCWPSEKSILAIDVGICGTAYRKKRGVPTHTLTVYGFLCTRKGWQRKMCSSGSRKSRYFQGNMFSFLLFAGEYLFYIELLFV